MSTYNPQILDSKYYSALRENKGSREKWVTPDLGYKKYKKKYFAVSEGKIK